MVLGVGCSGPRLRSPHGALIDTVESPWSPEQASSYMADSRNFVERDPGMRSSVLVREEACSGCASAASSRRAHILLMGAAQLSPRLW